MLFLVACVYDEGLNDNEFRVVEASSRLAVVEDILNHSDQWSDFLCRSRLYDPIVRGNARYYEDPRPVTPEEALTLIDRSGVDGDSRARLSISPIHEIITLPRKVE